MRLVSIVLLVQFLGIISETNHCVAEPLGRAPGFSIAREARTQASAENTPASKEYREEISLSAKDALLHEFGESRTLTKDEIPTVPTCCRGIKECRAELKLVEDEFQNLFTELEATQRRIILNNLSERNQHVEKRDALLSRWESSLQDVSYLENKYCEDPEQARVQRALVLQRFYRRYR